MNVTCEHTKESRPGCAPWLVDVPVRVMIWTRPELQKKQFDVIRQTRPSKLFFVSDGGRTPEERELIRQSREIVKDVDWDCEVHRLYWEENQGLYSTGNQSDRYIWQRVDRLVCLEDDIIPSVSFFEYCREMLERYEHDLRVHVVCGMNHMGVYDRPQSDYFFSHVGSIWGFAIWKRTYETYNNLAYKDDPYVIDEVCRIAQKDTYFCKAMRGYAQRERVDGHVPGAEFFQVLDMFAQNQLFIVPKKNLISCHGVAANSTHALNSVKKMDKGSAQVFFMETHELEFPLKPAEYVFPDLTYEKKLKRIIAWHHPLVGAYRHFVTIVKRIYYGDGLVLLKKVPQKLRQAFGKWDDEN